MARKQKVLPEVEEASSDSVPLRAQGKLQGSAEAEGAQPDDPEKRWRSMSKEPRHSSPEKPDLTLAQYRSQISRANRLSRYEADRAPSELGACRFGAWQSGAGPQAIAISWPVAATASSSVKHLVAGRDVTPHLRTHLAYPDAQLIHLHGLICAAHALN